MKKIVLILALGFVAVNFAFSQPWNKYLPTDKKDLTLKDYQKAFQKYWQPYDIENGWYKDTKGNKQKACGWKQFKRWEYFWESRVDPQTGAFPKTSAPEEFHKYVAKNGDYTKDGGNWVTLGTNSSTGGYAGIGRINTIAFHPSNDDIFWIGAPAGGLWETTDGGNSWTVLTDNNDVIGISAIVIPSDYETSNTIYIGTGDRDAYDNHSNGVLKSTDGGTTWNPTGLTFSLADGETVNRMLLHPNDDQTIFAATSDGVYKTTNGGDDWNQLYTTEFIDMEFCPTDPDIIYGGTRYGYIYKSTDGGVNWQMSLNTGSRVELAVSQDQPGVVYAVISNSSSGLHGIFKSTDYGTNFNLVFDDANLLTWDATGSGGGGQGWYDLALAADPNNGDVVYCGGVNTWRSTDGGYNWEIVNHWSGDLVQAVHADKHYLEFRRDQSVLFECNDGGVYITNDGTNWTDLTNGMIISQIYRLSVSQTDEEATINGLQDNGTKYYSSSGWEDVLGGDGMECIIDYTDENTQFGSLYYGQIYRTYNEWYNASNISNNIPGGASGAWVTPYTLDPNDPNTLYVGYSNLWKSTDQGNSFTGIGSFGGQLQSLAIAPSNSEVIYAATYSSIKRTTDGGTNWENITSGLPTSSSSIKYISVKNNDPNTAWVALSGYNGDGVYETTNGGATWNNISTGLPSIPVNCVIQNKLESSTIDLYAATDFGVYYKNANADWTLYSNGLPNVVVTELEIYYDMSNPPNSRLRASTYGRGLWESELELSGSYAPYVNTLQAQNISTNSADVTGEITNDFGDPVTESGIVYSTDPDPFIGGSNVDQIATDPLVTNGVFNISLSGLDHSSTYYFKAYAINANGVGYGGEMNFSTECLAVNEFPYTEDFESSPSMPLCWTQEYISGNENWIIETGNGYSSPGNAHSGINNMLLKKSGTQNSQTTLILPMLDLSGFDEAFLNFWHTQEDFISIQDELKVYYKNSPDGEWNLLEHYTESTADWLQEYIVLPSTSSTYYIAFEGIANGGEGICLDDITVEEYTGTGIIKNQKFKIFPNPAKDHLTIILNKEPIEGKLMKLLDVTGRTVYSSWLEKKLNLIDIPGLQKGIYIIKIDTAKETDFYQKIIIE